MRDEIYKIKFFSDYPKLHKQKRAKLLAVGKININKNTSKDFLEYDTKMANGKYYKLSEGTHLLLVFLGDKYIPFTTVRSCNNQYGNKQEYYKSKIGKLFEIEISKNNGGGN